MIKAIIVDMGGVYFSDGTTIAIERICKLAKAPKDEVHSLFRGLDSPGNLFRRGMLTPKKFWAVVAKRLKLNKDQIAQVRDLWYSSYKPMPGMKSLVARLRKRHRMIVFSGNIRERVKFLDRKYGIYGNFDNFVWSYDAGFNKDYIEFYEFLVEKLKNLGLKPSECIMVDDGNIKHRLRFGFKFVLFKNTKQAALDINRILSREN